VSFEKRNNYDTIVFVDVLSSPLAVVSPICNCGATVGIRRSFDWIVHDFNLKDSIGEITIVESKAKIIGIRRRRRDGI
jgi:hypothetical protein